MKHPFVFIDGCQKKDLYKNFLSIIKIMVANTTYNIWMERNNKIFQKSNVPKEHLLRWIFVEVSICISDYTWQANFHMYKVLINMRLIFYAIFLSYVLYFSFFY